MSLDDTINLMSGRIPEEEEDIKDLLMEALTEPQQKKTAKDKSRISEEVKVNRKIWLCHLLDPDLQSKFEKALGDTNKIEIEETRYLPDKHGGYYIVVTYIEASVTIVKEIAQEE